MERRSNIFPKYRFDDHGYKFPLEFCRSHVILRASLFNPRERAADGKVTASGGTFSKLARGSGAEISPGELELPVYNEQNSETV